MHNESKRECMMLSGEKAFPFSVLNCRYWQLVNQHLTSWRHYSLKLLQFRALESLLTVLWELGRHILLYLFVIFCTCYLSSGICGNFSGNYQVFFFFIFTELFSFVLLLYSRQWLVVLIAWGLHFHLVLVAEFVMQFHLLLRNVT